MWKFWKRTRIKFSTHVWPWKFILQLQVPLLSYHLARNIVYFSFFHSATLFIECCYNNKARDLSWPSLRKISSGFCQFKENWGCSEIILPIYVKANQKNGEWDSHVFFKISHFNGCENNFQGFDTFTSSFSKFSFHFYGLSFNFFFYLLILFLEQILKNSK